MKETILALLIAKFSGVRKDVLAHLAGSLALHVATEEEAKAIVEKLKPESVSEFARDLRKDVDKEVTDATRTHETNLKKKFDFKEKEAGNPDPSKGGDPKPGDTADVASIVKAAVAEAVKPLQDKLAGFEGDQVKKTRQQKLEEKLKDVPDSFKAQKLKDFGRMSFETDESFDAYLTETETDIKAFTQELADKGLAGMRKPFTGVKNGDGISKGVSDFIEATTAKDKPLQGKEV